MFLTKISSGCNMNYERELVGVTSSLWGRRYVSYNFISMVGMKYVAWCRNYEVSTHGLTPEGGSSLQPCPYSKVYKNNGSYSLWELNFGTQIN